MRGRGLLAVLAIAAVAVGGASLRSVEPKAARTAASRIAPSGAWFCPHGGGSSGWHVWLSVTNPGPIPRQIRVTTFARGGPTEPRKVVVPAQTDVRVPVKATSRGSSSEIEYFGGWVGASWVAQAQGDQSGIDSEPCVSSLGRSWLLPDGTTVKDEDSWVVVMNPTGALAVFDLTLVSEGQTVNFGPWTEFVLHPYRSTAFHLNQAKEGQRTVSAVIDVSLGQVAAASLGATKAGGIRASVGIPGPEKRAILPGATDSGHTELVVTNPGRARASYAGTLDGTDGTQTLGQLQGEILQPTQAKTYEITTPSDSSIELASTTGTGIAAARRSFGPNGDQGSTSGAPPASAWVVASGAAGPGDDWRLVLTNPGKSITTVKFWLVTPHGLGKNVSPRSLRVGPGRSRTVGIEFTQSSRLGAVMAVAADGTFVPLAASYTADGSGYSTAVGVPIPARWIPKSFR